MRFKPLDHHLFNIKILMTLSGRYRSFEPLPHHVSKRNLYTPSTHWPLWEAYQRHIKPADRYCLAKLENDWNQRQPLKGKVVLVNVHITTITLAMIGILLKAQATIEITASPELVRHANAMQALAAAQIPFFTSIPEHKKTGYYDIVYDCGAGMKDIIPKIGMVELTHTHPVIYDQMTFPVITVDQSKTKAIETGFGTGDSLVRVIHAIARQSIAAIALNFSPTLNRINLNRFYFSAFLSMVNSTQLFSHNKFMIFGFGKVGKGIANALESAGATKQNIFIVETSTEAYIDVMKNGYQGFFLDNHPQSGQGIQKIKTILPQMWAVITATGVEGTISRYFSQSDFDAVALLINMGTYDEFGAKFSIDRVLNHKKPANFMLDYPTEIIYLDPIFSLFLKAGEELLVNSTLKKGFNKISSQIDQVILKEWITQHGCDVWRHRLGQIETENLLHDLREHPTHLFKELPALVNRQSIFYQSNPIIPDLITTKIPCAAEDNCHG